MDRQKGLTVKEIVYIVEFNWDNSDAEVEPKVPSVEIPIDEANVLNSLCEEKTAADLRDELPEEIEAENLELDEVVATIPRDSTIESEFQKVDLKNLKWRKRNIEACEKQCSGSISEDVDVYTP